MADKKDQAKIIQETVKDFYALATSDFLIGHQFRKIQTQEGQDPLSPPLEAFEHHLPRINEFWELQLLGLKASKGFEPFKLIEVHQKLAIRKGELGRWVLLFYQVLEDKKKKYPDQQEFFDLWQSKIEHFKTKFLSSSSLFSQIRD